MNTVQVNNITIEPVIVQKFNEKTVLGYEYFNQPYSSTILAAATKSGKTTVIYRCLEKRVVEGMNVVICCPSVHYDATYKLMIKMLKAKTPMSLPTNIL